MTVNPHSRLPKSLIDAKRILSVETAILKTQVFALAGLKNTQKEYVCDFSILLLTIGKIFYNNVTANLPLWGNEQRYWDEIQMLESVWQMKMSPDSPDSSTQNTIFTSTVGSPDDSNDTTNSDNNNSLSLFDTPPVQLC